MAKILIIEDSIFERRAIVNFLNKGGYSETVEAGDGEEGIRLSGIENPDLVLLDLRMPGIDGIDVITQLKAMNKDAKILIISIIRNKSVIDKCSKLGADGYLTKPLTKDKLLGKIKEILG